MTVSEARIIAAYAKLATTSVLREAYQTLKFASVNDPSLVTAREVVWNELISRNN